MNGRFGIAPFAPLPMIEEYVAVVRAVLAGDAGGYAGQVFRTGMVPLDSPAVRSDLPIYLGALGPRMLALAGRIADGVILNLMSPAQAGEAAAIVRAAAKQAGRDPSSCPLPAWCTAACPTTRAGRGRGAGGGPALRAAPGGARAVRHGRRWLEPARA